MYPRTEGEALRQAVANLERQDDAQARFIADLVARVQEIESRLGMNT